MPDINDTYNARQLQLIAALTKKIKRIYETSIVNISFSAASINIKPEKFKLSLYPLLEKKIDQELKKVHADVYSSVVSGINQGWSNGNKKNDLIVDKRLAGKGPNKRARQILYDPNKDALNSFMARQEKGLNLSKRVWNTVLPFKKELTQAVGIGISEGKSAAKLATEIKKYLNEPEKLFRRVKEEGALKLSTAARNYHPGQGVYRSSYKNALRLSRTETNIAYRTADFHRWQKLPFVTGTEIRLSKNHPRYDICDQLVGKYPKDFKFTGWHPQCLCHQVPIMMSDAEYNQLEDQILNGDPISVNSEGLISKPPAGFEKYVRDNKKRIEGWANTPYWVSDNPDYYKGASRSRRKRTDPPKMISAGNPIGQQFTQVDKAISRQAKKSFELIDSVHGDGILRDIPIKRVSRQDYQAAFAHDIYGKPIQIMLSSKANDPELSLIHEMGHYFDLYAIGNRGVFNSHLSGSPTRKVIDVARQSNALTEMQSILDKDAIGDIPLAYYKQQHIEYLLSDHEIFARAYAQYIATVTGNSKLLTGIKRRVDAKIHSGVLQQWEADDFAAIKEAMDELMLGLGWRVSQ